MRLIDQPLPGLELAAEAWQIERDFVGAGTSGSARLAGGGLSAGGRDARWGHNTPPMTVDADDAAGLRAELAN